MAAELAAVMAATGKSITSHTRIATTPQLTTTTGEKKVGCPSFENKKRGILVSQQFV
jgi:hypothetical protein